MNLIGTALERIDSNPYYAKFKSQNPTTTDEEYEWKCWMLKKYFKDNIISELVKIILGAFLLFMAGSSTIYKMLGNKGFGNIIVIICLVLGIILIGTGIIFSFSNYKCLKHYKDYSWDEDSEIVPKIIKFYEKK